MSACMSAKLLRDTAGIRAPRRRCAHDRCNAHTIAGLKFMRIAAIFNVQLLWLWKHHFCSSSFQFSSMRNGHNCPIFYNRRKHSTKNEFEIDLFEVDTRLLQIDCCRRVRSASEPAHSRKQVDHCTHFNCSCTLQCCTKVWKSSILWWRCSKEAADVRLNEIHPCKIIATDRY